MQSYLPLLSVSVSHDFFGGAWPGLQWRPTPQTQRLLARAACVAGPSRDGLALYFDSSRRDLLASCLADVREPMTLVYRLRWTGLPIEAITGGVDRQANRVLFLSSEAALAQADGVRRLHAGDAVGPGEWKDTDAPQVQALLEAADRVVRPAPIVQLSLGSQDMPSGQEDSLGKRFAIRFAARATYWKYFFVGDWPAQDMRVVDVAEQAQFGPPATETLADGRAAVTVRSAQAIALQQRPQQHFQLRRRERGEELVLIERLPAAAAGALASETVDGLSAAVSEIYV